MTAAFDDVVAQAKAHKLAADVVAKLASAAVMSSPSTVTVRVSPAP